MMLGIKETLNNFKVNFDSFFSESYLYDKKVGIWTEYFITIGKKKREINFFNDPFNKNYKPVITKEWSINGKLVYDRTAFLKKIN